MLRRIYSSSGIPRQLELVQFVITNERFLMPRHFIHRVTSTSRRIGAEAEMDTLGLRSRLLLLMIGEAQEFGTSTRVGDVVKQSRLGTPPTVYAALSELESGGWIEKRQDTSDHRASTLHLTAKARRAFDRMSKRIAKLAQDYTDPAARRD